MDDIQNPAERFLKSVKIEIDEIKTGLFIHYDSQNNHGTCFTLENYYYNHDSFKSYLFIGMDEFELISSAICEFYNFEYYSNTNMIEFRTLLKIIERLKMIAYYTINDPYSSKIDDYTKENQNDIVLDGLDIFASNAEIMKKRKQIYNFYQIVIQFMMNRDLEYPQDECLNICGL